MIHFPDREVICDPHRAFLEQRIGEKPDITMLELAAEMADPGGEDHPCLAVALASAAQLPV